MGRIFITMLGYNNSDIVKDGMQNLEDTTTDLEHRRLVKTVFLCQYPLPSVEENRSEIIKHACNYGWWHAEIPNMGGLENHNVAIHQYCHMQKGDYYVCHDPDVRWQQKGWITAAIEILESDPDCVFVCAARPFHDEKWCSDHHGREIYELPSGTKVAKYKQLVAWSTGVWKGEWLAQRPRHFKAARTYYGYFEHADIELMNKHGKTWRSLVDYYDNHIGPKDQSYVDWKIESAQFKTDVAFDTWLRSKGKL